MRHSILNTYKRGRDADLIKISYRIIDSITGNPNFPDPPEALAKAKKVLEEYQAALSNAGGRDRAMVSIKNDKRAELRALISELADYITIKSKGDRSLLLLSGFDISQGRGEKQLTPIAELEVEIGQPGQALSLIHI